jgi:hypothetical protein
MTPEQAEAHGTPVAVLRPRLVRGLVELLSPLPARKRTTILAQAIQTMTRVGADQVVFVIAWTTTAAQRQRHFNEAPQMREHASAVPIEARHAGRLSRVGREGRQAASVDHVDLARTIAQLDSFALLAPPRKSDAHSRRVRSTSVWICPTVATAHRNEVHGADRWALLASTRLPFGAT